MKYIISESRLDDIIQKYLSSQLSDLKEVEKSESDSEGRQIWYVDKSGEPLVVIYPRYHGGDLLVLRRVIYETVANMFGLKTTDDIQAPILKYFEEKWGMLTRRIYTFEDYDSL
jgi:hypothetical protein